jgi:hypothetical protein
MVAIPFVIGYLGYKTDVSEFAGHIWDCLADEHLGVVGYARQEERGHDCRVLDSRGSIEGMFCTYPDIDVKI